MAKKIKQSDLEEDLFRIACFMLFDALIFHEVVSNGHTAVKAVSNRPKANLRSFMRAEWLKIRNNINYKPVFDLAIEIIDSLPASPDTEAIIESLSNAAVDAVTSGILLKHDFMGRIYHKLLLRSTGHYYATYYTSLPAAWLLSGLVYREDHHFWDFGELSSFENFKVIDPACGSGTLLSASYASLRDQYIKSTPDAVDLGVFHEAMLSHTIHGWDVLDFAAHLSLTNLALHSDTVHSNRSNIYRMPLGAREGHAVQLGSLEYLKKSIELKGIALSDPVEELDFDGRSEIDLGRDQFDVVIMNPPFSRSAKPNLTFGYSENEVRSRMQKALSEIGNARGLFKAAVAGLTPFFMELGLEMVNPKGRIGIVAPRSTLSGVGSSRTRLHYERDTNIRYVVSNFDPGIKAEKVDGWSWSENTDLGEVLIVAHASASDNAQTYFVNVLYRPRNEMEALILSQKIIATVERCTDLDLLQGHWEEISVLDKAVAVLYSVPQSKLRGNWLRPCTFASPVLNRLIYQIVDSPGLVLIEKFLKVINGREYATGRDIAPVKQNFKQHRLTAEARMIFGHQAAMSKMAMPKNFVQNAKAKNGLKSVKMFKDFSARLILAERPHLSTENLLAFYSPEPVLTTAFWELQGHSDIDDLWLLLWFNSTYGILSYLSISTSSQGDIFKLKKDQLKFAKVPKLKASTRMKVRAFYTDCKDSDFSTYAREALLCSKGKGSRFKLDEFLRRETGLPKITKEEYIALSNDPALTKTPLY